MTPEQKVQLEELIQVGTPQFVICKQLGLGRGSVQRVRQKLGVTGERPGVPTPKLTAAQEKQVLGLLASGKGSVRVASELGVGERSVRLCAKKHGFRRGPGSPGYRLPEVEREKIVRMIKGRKTKLAAIAKRSTVSHTTVKKIARKVLGGPLVGGNGREALRSNFALKHYDEEEFPWLHRRAATKDHNFGQLAELISEKVFHGKLPRGAAAVISRAVLQTIFPDEQNETVLRLFGLELSGALAAREIAQDAEYLS
jgi:hypothetical protein